MTMGVTAGASQLETVTAATAVTVVSFESRALQPNKDRPAGDRNEMGRG
jgi:hypothetical protein